MPHQVEDFQEGFRETPTSFRPHHLSHDPLICLLPRSNPIQRQKLGWFHLAQYLSDAKSVHCRSQESSQQQSLGRVSRPVYSEVCTGQPPRAVGGGTWKGHSVKSLPFFPRRTHPTSQPAVPMHLCSTPLPAALVQVSTAVIKHRGQ